MALINKIREKSGFAIGAIAIGLLIFIVLGDLLGPNSRLFGDKLVVGEVAGHEVSVQEFDAMFEEAKNNYTSQYGRPPSEAELASLREQTWNQLVFKYAFEEEFEKVGLGISAEEQVDMVQGRNVHPALRQMFTDPQTGMFNVEQVKQTLRNLGSMPAEQQAAWRKYEADLATDRLRNKYYNLFTFSNYVTTEEAKRFNAEQNTKASITSLFVPYFSIADSAIKVTDDQLSEYLNKNKKKFEVEEGRSLTYVTIPVTASKEDSTQYSEETAELAARFATTENDSLFVKAESDTPFNSAYVAANELPEELKNQSLEKGKMYGPFMQNGNFSLYKIMDVKDGGQASVRASHILIKPENTTPEAKAAAKAKAQDLLNQIKGGANFAQLAAQHGTDGTASMGGDLGWFTEGRMVPAFEKAVFGASGAGLLPNLVETDYGYHIVKITEPKTTRTYQVAQVSRAMTPSDNSRESAFGRASAIASNSSSLEDFKKAVANEKGVMQAEAKNITAADRAINNLQNARELVRWAFSEDTKKGDVSPVITMDDQYVVAVLTGKREKGTAKVEDVRDELTAAVRNEQKAKKIKDKLASLSGSLDQIAAKYGPDALVRPANDVTLGAATVPGLGYEPVAIGKAFGLKPGQRTGPIDGEGGVVMVELKSITPAAPVADIASVKQQLQGVRAGRAQSALYEAVRKNANIEDNRVRFF
ncbi:SurA N-terminal domain-containing protein [Rufibacter glacialis]|uniref:Periplasmic chaperone PpiD n=1 Tax=Rufibacter glacialis TaxID=1259555 RepID=A0A5M8QEX7_9BACT|nr:peptidylprolyl isomerase [Rufibacter glacialis]KAA6433524.1 peptidylprolyl isomerase [Rufibacter glacialis]GGK73409.1 peptidylprolyl isomerase [Rufibacter glacialis]